MAEKIVFKLEKNPKGHTQSFAENCEIQIAKTKGILFLHFNHSWPIGSFDNLRRDGDTVLADVEIFKNHKIYEDRFEYAISGTVLESNEEGEAKSVRIDGVSALMPETD